MLLHQPWMNGLADLEIELRQAQDEGKALTDAIKSRAEKLKGMAANDRHALHEAIALYRDVQTLPTIPDYPYIEPEGFSEILDARPCQISLPQWKGEKTELYDRIYGGWLARCCGCLLGQPVEGWRSQRILGLLKESGNYPIHTYFTSQLPSEVRERYDVSDEGGPYGAEKKSWINNVACMPEDDDTNYTVLALRLVEKYGRDFAPEDVAECWLSSLPLLHTCTAERIAYLNLCKLYLPPQSALFCNPYREWIGAQIRADLFGYINPGDPKTASEMALRDAYISHTKNGIYGEMFVAAMIAAAFVVEDIPTIIRAGLDMIPPQCRLAESIRLLLFLKEKGAGPEEAIKAIREHWDENNPHDWCHVISNAMLVTVGLLYGEKDLSASLSFGILYGFDTDCNAATIGSILGVLWGAKKLPAHWTEPLHDRLLSGVDGLGSVAISHLAQRTADLAKVSPT